MKTFQVLTISSMWSTEKLKSEVERTLNKKSAEGYELVSISFGFNVWWVPTAYITLSK